MADFLRGFSNGLQIFAAVSDGRSELKNIMILMALSSVEDTF